MQPYLFPYIGYLQLMAACDLFVIRDNVQYAKQTWVNRNRILINGAPQWLTVPVAGADFNLSIAARTYLFDRHHPQRLLRRISGAYRHAPYFPEAYRLVEEIMQFPESNVAAFNTNLLRKLAKALGIRTPVVIASHFERPSGLDGQDRVLDICAQLGASAYTNPIGGLALYQPECFARRGLELMFLQSRARAYCQFDNPFVPSLSIVDVLMFNDIASTRAMLGEFRLIRNHSEIETI